MKPWIKAGLVGGVAGIVLTLPAFATFYIPLTIGTIISTYVSIVFLLLYPGVGALAAFWLPPPRAAKRAALDGALAGSLAFTIDGIATVLMYLIVLWTGGVEQYLQQLVPYATSEIVARTNSLTMGVMIGCSCLNILLGALFGACGGIVFASVKPE